MRSSILAVLTFLAVLGLTASAASAGPNAGGVLWVHDTGIVFSTNPSLPPMSTPPADCAGVDNQQDADGVDRIWKVYAAFPEGSSPQLKSTGFGTRFPDAPPDPYITIDAAGCGAPAGVTWDGTGGFPTASGGEVWLNFLSPGQATVVELFYFTGSAGTGQSEEPRPLTWCTFQRSSSDENVFLDDAVPQSEDPVRGWGCLGFGMPGSTPCPQSLGCCCRIDGSFGVTTQAMCVSPDDWIAGSTCIPCPCPQPPPLNDTCEGAILLPPCLGLSLQGDAMWANDDYNPQPPFPGCTGSGAPGRDVVCELNMVPGQAFSVTYTRTTSDASIYLVTDCSNPGNSCVIGADAAGIGGGETLDYTSVDGGTYYLILDARTNDGGGIPVPQPWTLDYFSSCPTGCCCDHAGDSRITTEPDCSALGFEWLGAGVLCDPVTCPPWAPCCLGDGASHCLSEVDCLSSSGTWLVDEPCIFSPDPCPSACCVPGLCCKMMTQAECAMVSGFWHEGLPCIPNPCPEPISACCFPDGSCQMLEGGYCVCIAEGVVYPFDVCDPNPCHPLGVCCNPALGSPADCTITTEPSCPAPCIWHPDWPLICDPDPCNPMPTGNCCNSLIGFPLGCTITTQPDCLFDWLGDLPCDAVSCPPPAVLGVCCNYLVGPPLDCTITTEPACLMPCIWHPDWPLACDPDPCNPIPTTGSCCYSDGICAVTTQVACTAPAIWTEGAGCVPNECPQPTGSCCYPGGTCVVTAQADCAGTWHEGGACEPNPCVQPPEQGACCNTITGACTITTQVACVAPLVWRGAGMPCALENCSPSTPVERTSWGQIKNTYR